MLIRFGLIALILPLWISVPAFGESSICVALTMADQLGSNYRALSFDGTFSEPALPRDPGFAALPNLIKIEREFLQIGLTHPQATQSAITFWFPQASRPSSPVASLLNSTPGLSISDGAVAHAHFSLDFITPANPSDAHQSPEALMVFNAVLGAVQKYEWLTGVTTRSMEDTRGTRVTLGVSLYLRASQDYTNLKALTAELVTILGSAPK